ncbi:MAG TPA: carboxymuconolactone decarboxylase family protein [Bdellovibrionota bacterium]|jgi:AhpD family alkylhydroperoxidase|nr:carboxymuconolactone decarboxylase family protein [Bdellovibrionota bacterium]
MSRLNYFALAGAAFQHLAAIDKYCKESSVEPAIMRLAQIYASQINGCAFCVDIHCKEAKIAGERELRIYHIPVWKESPLFSQKEKTALEWTRAVTLISEGPVSDELFQRMRQHYSDKEIVDFNMQIAFINLFNRFAATFQSVPGERDKVLGLEKAKLE